MPSRKEIQWSQLRVGVLVLAAMAVLVALIFLMSNTTGGLFEHRLLLRSYFGNAAGLKDGAPVTLEGVTIGNVIHVRVVPDRDPTPVEVTMQVGQKFRHLLHVDSTSMISQSGVLGDSYVDISSINASGPAPPENAELRTTGAPSIQQVITSSDISIKQINTLMKKVETLVDTLNSRLGTVGEFINDPELYRKITQIATDLQNITSSISEGKGSLGKFVNDDTLYNRANSAVERINKMTAELNEGKGSAGKFLKDDTLYDNLNTTVASANQLMAEINAGKGAAGKIAKDPVFAQKVDDLVTRLDSILKDLDEGKGTAGQFLKNRSVYDQADKTLEETTQLVKSIREDPKKYLVIRMKIF